MFVVKLMPNGQTFIFTTHNDQPAWQEIVVPANGDPVRSWVEDGTGDAVEFWRQREKLLAQRFVPGGNIRYRHELKVGYHWLRRGSGSHIIPSWQETRPITKAMKELGISIGELLYADLSLYPNGIDLSSSYPRKDILTDGQISWRPKKQAPYHVNEMHDRWWIQDPSYVVTACLGKNRCPEVIVWPHANADTVIGILRDLAARHPEGCRLPIWELDHHGSLLHFQLNPRPAAEY